MASGCCGRSTKVKKFVYEEDEDVGPTKERKCTDVIFLIIFISYLGGMSFVGYLAFSKGNINLLYYGYDSWGNICGQVNEDLKISSELAGTNLTKRQKLFYFDETYFMAALPSMGITPDPDPIIVCVIKCPDENMIVGTDVNSFASRTGSSVCRYDVDSYTHNDTLCPELPITPHKSLINRCIPEAVFQAASTASSSLTHLISGSTAQSIVSDIVTSWKEILYMSFIGFGTSLLVLVMVQLCAGIIVWVLVVFMAAMVTGAAGFSWYKYYLANKLYTSTDQTPEQAEVARTWLIYSIIVTIVAVVILLILLVMRKRIKLVVQLFKEAGSAITKMPFLLLQPLWTIIILTAVIGAFLILTLFMESSKYPVVRSSGFVKYELEEMMSYLRWYHLFGVLWVTAFIVACQDIVIAGAVAIWYFSRNKSKLGFPICRSTCNLIKYHMGSVAIGSFLIALVRFIRIILMTIQQSSISIIDSYIDVLTSTLPSNGGEVQLSSRIFRPLNVLIHLSLKRLKGKTNKCAEFLFKMLHCCMVCFERFLQFLNRNAYIQIAIHGTSFCESARKALVVIINNALRVVAINSVATFLLFLSKLGCVAIVMMVGSKLIEFHEDIHYKWVPLTVGGALTFVIAHCFFLVYEICIDTIFMCFCEDCDMNDGIEKPYFMSKNLMACVSNPEMKTNKVAKPISKPRRSSQSKSSPQSLRSPRRASTQQDSESDSSPKGRGSPKGGKKQRW